MKANLRNRQSGNESDRYQAVKIFTDREDPQEAFERKLRRLSRDETWKEEFYVLSYYGIGGIGKTSFLRKLCRVIKGIPGNDRRLPDPIDCHYFLYDFGSCDGKPNKLSVLLEWRVQLGKQNPKFRFEQFDAALVTYGLKTGRDLKNNSTVSSLLEASPWLAQLFSAVDSVSGFVNVPGISDVTKAIKAIKWLDNAVKVARNQRLKAVLSEMRQMEPVELLDNLHTYFAEDMQENMTEIAKKPVVILLDTYERFVDAENRERDMMTADHWLRKGPDSVIQQIPGILWVISGRERLRWSEDDMWDEEKAPHAPGKMTEEEKEALAATGLEQHRLGDLSLADATAFLQAAGVRDETLWEPIYKLTKGTPFYLDICVNIANVSKTPTIADFGKNIDELVVRFFQGLTDQSREMLCFLACLGSFTDEIVFEIAEAANRLNYYSKQWYREFVLHSVIVPCEDGSYYVHETVRVAALKKVDEDLAAEIYRLRLERLQKLVQDVARLDIADVLADYVAALVEAPIEDSEFESHLRVLLNKLGVLYHTGEWTVLLQLIETLFRSVRKRDPESTLTVITRAKYCGMLCDWGLYARALEEITAVNVEGDVPAGVETADWLELQRIATRVYLENFLPEQALTLAKQTNELHKRKLGEDHRDTLSAMSNLANAHKAMGEGTTTDAGRRPSGYTGGNEQSGILLP